MSLSSRALALSIVALLTAPAAYAAPCAIKADAGAITADRPWPLVAPFSAADAACIVEAGKVLKDLPGLGSVTVAARLADDQRVGGKALAAARAFADAFTSAGIPAARITALAPRPAPGEAPNIRISFTQAQSARVVAVVISAKGDVVAGATESLAKAVVAGRTTLVAGDLIRTGTDGRAAVALADGSEISLGTGSLVKLGEVSLDAQLQRKVRLEVVRGAVEVAAAKVGGGSFEVATRAGNAGVRGTRFRVIAEGDGSTSRIETTEGSVGVKGQAGDEVAVNAGFGLRVKQGEAAPSARKLPATPVVEGPLKGETDATTPIRWSKVEGAASYLVQSAEDGEFLFDVESVTATATELAAKTALALPGKRFFRVFAVDADGFASAASRTYALKVR